VAKAAEKTITDNIAAEIRSAEAAREEARIQSAAAAIREQRRREAAKTAAREDTRGPRGNSLE